VTFGILSGKSQELTGSVFSKFNVSVSVKSLLTNLDGGGAGMLLTHSSHVCATCDQLAGTAARSTVFVELLYEIELTTNGRRYVFHPQSPIPTTRTKVRFPL
jgi:hypothetical protein